MASARLRALRADMAKLATRERAAGAARFFKTGKGEYGEGDRFLGVTVPDLRKVARAARDLAYEDTLELLRSPWHEERSLALFILVSAHDKGDDATKATILKDYLANTDYINNWDLVDSSAAQIVGHELARKGTRLIERLAKSKSLWERRIAMIATFSTIRAGDYAPTLLIAERLIRDQHDLIQKAVGWMLREMGKRDVAALRKFLDKHAGTMPRTALRYAIERLPPPERQRYMSS